MLSFGFIFRTIVRVSGVKYNRIPSLLAEVVVQCCCRRIDFILEVNYAIFHVYCILHIHKF